MKRHETVPEDLIEHLRKTIPGFKNESEKYQWELANMVWEGGSKKRRHKGVEGAMSFTHTELEKAFGRGGFTSMNQRLDFFKVSENWSKDRSLTKAYWFSDHVIKSRNTYLKRRWKKTVRLIYSDMTAAKSVPAAVASKDMDGITTYSWRHAKTMNSVPVNLAGLEALRKWLEVISREIRAGRLTPTLHAPAPTPEMVARLLETTSKVIRMSMTDVAGEGYITQRYVEATSGRLYAVGINLQSCSKLVKQAALDGLWEYDLANCHYAILDQMAAQFGYECNAIRHYTANKKAVRQQIAQETGITELEAKICLLALIYGARASEWHENAIPQTIGVEAAKRLIKAPLFSGIAADIEGARQAILAGCERTRKGGLVNVFGKSLSLRKGKGIKAQKRTPAQQLAHLIQGVEALALKTVTSLYPDEVVLLEHDGFVAKTRLNVQALEEAILKETGYRFVIEDERIQPDPDAQIIREFSKMKSGF